jgi:hypothetical protein
MKPVANQSPSSSRRQARSGGQTFLCVMLRCHDFKAVLKHSHSKRFATAKPHRIARQRLECVRFIGAVAADVRRLILNEEGRMQNGETKSEPRHLGCYGHDK